MTELFIIKAFLLDKDIYTKYYNIIVNNINTQEVSKILLVINNIYTNNNINNISVDDFVLRFYTDYPFIREKEKNKLEILFDKLRVLEVNKDLVEDYIKSVIKFNTANSLAIAAIDFAQGKKSLQDISPLWDELASDVEIDAEAPEEVEDDLETLLIAQVLGGGLKWRHEPLNKSLGPLRKGDFGFVFKRPETGGTTFLADSVSFMVNQIEDNESILWFNNEEQGGKVKLRCIQAYFGKSIWDLRAGAANYGHRWREEVKGRIKIIDQAALHRGFIEKYCKLHKPRLIVVDQLDKVKGFEGEREDLRLGTIYQWAREIAKEYSPFIGVSQADGTGEGRAFLTMDNVANAKTAKQAEADFILGIGATHQAGQEYIRFFNISKNKLVGDEQTEPGLRHAQFSLMIKPEIARYETI